jgi:hypothetical protein
LHYPIKEPIISYDFESEEIKNCKDEIDANEYSRNLLISPNDYSEFIRKGSFSDNSIRIFAKQQGITPDIVLGRLQHDGKVDYSQFSRMRFDLLN